VVVPCDGSSEGGKAGAREMYVRPVLRLMPASTVEIRTASKA
jgi:hypothetical protein